MVPDTRSRLDEDRRAAVSTCIWRNPQPLRRYDVQGARYVGGSDLLPPPACLLLLALRRTLLAMSKDDRRGLDVGSFIRQQRERANISLRKLADKAGISNPYLSQIERGLRKPSAEILKSIARGLSIQAESLYQRAGLLDEGFDPPSVIEAIESDAQLNQRQKRVLLDIYRTYVQEEEEE